jgi:hypothetical protein
MRHELDAAQRQEAAANSFGQVHLAIVLDVNNRAQDVPQLRFHGTAVSGGRNPP